MPTPRERLHTELSHIPPGDTSMFGAYQAAFHSTYASRRKMDLTNDPTAPRGVTMLGLVTLEHHRHPAWVPSFDWDYFGFCLLPREADKM